MSKKRRFIYDECVHIYQRTVNGQNIFYDREDFLFCLTILTTSARKFNIRILEICFMIDHIHILVVCDSCRQMAEFVRYYSSILVHEYNISVGRTGQLLYKSFGSAPRKGEKKTRSTIVYIGNNPVEKKLCIRAEQYRWNFLAYIENTMPFSQENSTQRYSNRLQKAITEVHISNKLNRYLNPVMLYRLFKNLNDTESEILTDKIVSEYMPINTEELFKYYSSLEQMLIAMDSSTGNDFDIREKYWPGSDIIYHDMIKYIRNVKGIYPVRKIIQYSNIEKRDLAEELRAFFGANDIQLKKFLHL